MLAFKASWRLDCVAALYRDITISQGVAGLDG